MYTDTALTRITPKFSKANNFINLLKFMVGILDADSDLKVLSILRDLDSGNSLAIEEIAKILGVKRPRIPIKGSFKWFQYEQHGYNIYPYFSTYGNTTSRFLNNEEFARYLKAVASLSTTQGTIDDWLRFYGFILQARVSVINKGGDSKFIVNAHGTIKQADLEIARLLIENFNNLTVGTPIIKVLNPVGFKFILGQSVLGDTL